VTNKSTNKINQSINQSINYTDGVSLKKKNRSRRGHCL